MTTTWQLSDVRDEVRERLGVSSGDSALTNAVLTALVNAANRKISLLHDWPWLIEEDADFTALVAGQRKYEVTVPEDEWRKTLFLIVDDDQLMSVKQPQDIHRYASQTGFPFYYSIQGTDIYVAPTPDSAYDILHVYVKAPTVVSSDSDVLDVEDWAIDLLIDKTAVLAARRLRDSDLRGEMESEYAQTLSTMQDEVRRTRQYPKPKHRTDIGWP